jgi:hypothetical protein
MCIGQGATNISRENRTKDFRNRRNYLDDTVIA